MIQNAENTGKKNLSITSARNDHYYFGVFLPILCLRTQKF